MTNQGEMNVFKRFKLLLLLIMIIAFLFPKYIKACCQVCPEDFYDELSFLEEVSIHDKLYAVNKFHMEHGIKQIPCSSHKEFAKYLNSRKLASLSKKSDYNVYNNLNIIYIHVAIIMS